MQQQRLCIYGRSTTHIWCQVLLPFSIFVPISVNVASLWGLPGLFLWEGCMTSIKCPPNRGNYFSPWGTQTPQTPLSAPGPGPELRIFRLLCSTVYRILVVLKCSPPCQWFWGTYVLSSLLYFNSFSVSLSSVLLAGVLFLNDHNVLPSLPFSFSLCPSPWAWLLTLYNSAALLWVYLTTLHTCQVLWL